MKKALNFSAVILLFTIMFSGCSKDPMEEVVPEIQLKGYSSGTNNGYFWSLYREGGSASINFGSAGNFSISYNNVTDVVGGKGWRYGSAKNIGYNIGSLSGRYNFVGVYGWTTNPLIEYYIAEKGSMKGGTYVNSISSDGHSYSFYKYRQVNKPSIIGTQTFWQYRDTWGGAPTGSNRNINMSNHINNWRSKGGQGFGSYDYQVFGLEAWGGKSGYINATVWENDGDDGGDDGGDELPMTLRARSTDGKGQVSLIVGGNKCKTWTLGTSMRNYDISLWSSRGNIEIRFSNDASGRDIQVDYLKVGNDTRQAENQSYNSSVWQNSSCGGSYSEWMHCNGSIGFGNTP